MRPVLALAALSAVAVVAATLAQAQPTATPKPLPGLPQWTAGYTAWAKVNRAPIPTRPSDAHRGTKNVYASKRARNASQPRRLSIAVGGRRTHTEYRYTTPNTMNTTPNR